MVRGRAGLIDAAIRRAGRQGLTPAAARQLQPRTVRRGTGRHAAARRWADQARVLRRAREPELRPAAGRCRQRQRRPAAQRVRQGGARRTCIRSSTRFPLMDNVYANSEASIEGHYWTAAAEHPRLRQPQLGPGVRRPRAAQRLRRVRGDLARATASCSTRPSASASPTSTTARASPAAGPMSRTATARPPSSRREKRSRPTPTSAAATGGCSRPTAIDGTARRRDRWRDVRLEPPRGAPTAATPTWTASGRGSTSSSPRTPSRPAATSRSPATTRAARSPASPRRPPWWPTATWPSASSSRLISHSSIWSSSAVFVVEDDSQDGADHVNAHRIPVVVVSPYARAGRDHAHALRPALGRALRWS